MKLWQPKLEMFLKDFYCMMKMNALCGIMNDEYKSQLFMNPQ